MSWSQWAGGEPLCRVSHLQAFEQYVLDALEEQLVKPLRTDVENDLRLRIHTKNLEFMTTPNPKKESARQLRPFLELKPLRVFEQLFDVKAKVTRNLERVFYSLTAVALHDWMTYADMRDLAFEKYGLDIADNHLPMGSLDQGLDVLRIMQNIHIFVARFSYNLNQQNFVERRPDRGSKNVRTISIQSIAASLRQHGLGILNTTVNFTYQFLGQKCGLFLFPRPEGFQSGPLRPTILTHHMSHTTTCPPVSRWTCAMSSCQVRRVQPVPLRRLHPLAPLQRAPLVPQAQGRGRLDVPARARACVRQGHPQARRRRERAHVPRPVPRAHHRGTVVKKALHSITEPDRQRAGQ